MDDFSRDMEAHVEGLRRYARALIGNPFDADDLVQECLKRVLTYTADRSDIINWRAYIYATFHNVRAEKFVSDRKRNHVSIDDFAEEAFCAAPQHAHLDCLDLARGLAQLPEAQRQVLLLVGLQGFSYREVAAVQSIPLGTVMSRLSRARAALRAVMSETCQQEGEEDEKTELSQASGNRQGAFVSN